MPLIDLGWSSCLLLNELTERAAAFRLLQPTNQTGGFDEPDMMYRRRSRLHRGRVLLKAPSLA
jgi:hypothetical protein